MNINDGQPDLFDPMREMMDEYGRVGQAASALPR